MTSDNNQQIIKEFRANGGRVGGPWEVGSPNACSRRVTGRHAATRAGFADQSHLHRHFRKMGMRPGRYARAVAL
jgi:AraC-like DNA-binding protein